MKYFGRILLAIIFVFVVGFGFLLFSLFNRPTTAEMKEYFFERQGAFEYKNAELLSAVAENKTIEKRGDQETGYRYLKITDQPAFQVLYYTHVLGIGTGSCGTGIAYMESPPNKIYPDFEAMYDDASEVEGFIGYSHILGSWYCFLWTPN